MASLWEKWFGVTSQSSEELPETTPFSTQANVLTKYNLGTKPSGLFVGMCKPMANTYVGLLLDNKDPTAVLADDKNFLTQSIKEENEELDADNQQEPDIEHHAFNKRKIPHRHQQVPKSELSPSKLTTLLRQSQHLLLTYPTTPSEPPNQPDTYHEVYLGRQGKTLKDGCRFFDANVPKGERKGPCEQVINDFYKAMREQYTDKDASFSVGMSLP